MAQNIWTQELVRTGLMTSATTGNARWVDRNGESAMELRPNVFYYSSTYGNLMSGSFEPNTRYCFDLWIDPDDYGAAGYSGQANGIRVYYTGSTSGNSGMNLLAAAASGSVLGWTHKKWISPENTTITAVNVYYSRAYNWYSRWDSSVSKLEDIEYRKTGVVGVGQIKTNSETVEPSEGGIVSCNNIVEY